VSASPTGAHAHPTPYHLFVSPRANNRPAVLGLDLGTGGARVIVVAEDGEVLAMAGAGIERIDGHARLAAEGRHEQDPEAWWAAARAALRAALATLDQHSGPPCELRALAVDGTSGTLVGVDAAGRPTTPALMYDDGRAIEEARELAGLQDSGATVSATSGTAKMRWIEGHRPRDFERTHVFLHQADFVVTRLTGEVGVTDASNALKSGFDLGRGAWATWLDKLPELRARLARVIEPGETIGTIRAEVAEELGLPRGLKIVAGATDGTAAFIASGASRVGEDNTTLGTTLVFKRVAEREVRDPEGLLYCHKLPGQVWLPGAASNVGGGWIREHFGDADLGQLDEAAQALLPTAHLAYPLVSRGERFPFLAPAAEGFCEPPPENPGALYAANLQGIALFERLAYETLDRVLGAPTEGDAPAVFATGGGARSDLWLQLRADVCQRIYHRPACSESAFGSAVLAAGNALFDDLWQASRAMVRIERSFQPDPARSRLYDEYHPRFRAEFVRRGYLPS